MLPYKLTFISEVDHKNRNDDLGLEHPEESNTEMKDFNVTQRTAVSVNSPFETPVKTWTHADILDLDSQVNSDSMPNKVRRSDGTDTDSMIVRDRNGTTTDGSIKVIKCQDNENSDGWSIDMNVERILNRHLVPSGTESEIPPQFIQLGETPRAGELPFKNHHSYNATILTVTSPDNFYIRLLPWRALKKKTEKIVDAFYKTLTTSCQDFGTTNHELLKAGLIVACNYEGLWRRAEILFACGPLEKNAVFNDFEYKVLLIDEGEEVQVTQSQLRYLTKNFLQHRRRVQKCSLFNPHVIWNSSAVARFNEIVVPESHVTLKILRKHEQIWDVSIKMNLRGNSRFDNRNVDIGRELFTFQRRRRIIAMYKPPLDTDSNNGADDADDEDSDSGPEQVKK